MQAFFIYLKILQKIFTSTRTSGISLRDKNEREKGFALGQLVREGGESYGEIYFQ